MDYASKREEGDRVFCLRREKREHRKGQEERPEEEYSEFPDRIVHSLRRQICLRADRRLPYFLHPSIRLRMNHKES